MREQCRGLAVWPHRCMPDRISVRAAWRGVAVFGRARVGAQAYMRLEKRSWTCVDMHRERTDSLLERRTLDASVVQPASRTRPTHAGNRRGTWIDRRCLNLYCSAQRVHSACVHPCACARACACTCVRLRVQARVHVCRACALRLRVQARVHVCGSDVGHRCTVGRGRDCAGVRTACRPSQVATETPAPASTCSSLKSH